MTIQSLPRGGNASLQANLAAEHGALRVVLEWAGDIAPTPSVDAIAFCLGESGRVRAESDMVFYNNRQGASGAVVMPPAEGEARGHRLQPFALDLEKLPSSVVRIVFAVVIDAGGGGVLSVGQLKQLCLRVVGGKSGHDLARCDFTMTDAPETALMMGEVYRRNGEWKVKSVGQGFGAGLAALAESFGVVVADAAQASGQMARPSVTTPQPLPVAGRPIVPSIKLDPPPVPGHFGEVAFNLTWGAAPASELTQDDMPQPTALRKPSLLGSLLKPKPVVSKMVDLDLCCLYELNDGYRGVVQALGNNLGAYNSAPYLELMGDERKGAGERSELLRLNGSRWSELRRLLIFVMIFEGMPNWAQAAGKVTIRIPDQVPISVRLDQTKAADRVCSVALIENEGGRMVINKRVETFKTPRDLDQTYAWGLRWAAGMKD